MPPKKAAAAVKAKPAENNKPVVKENVKPAAKGDAKPAVTPKAATPKAAAKAEPKAAVKADPKPAAKADPKPAAKADPKPAAKADPKPAAKAEVKAVAKPAAKEEVKPAPKEKPEENNEEVVEINDEEEEDVAAEENGDDETGEAGDDVNENAQEESGGDDTLKADEGTEDKTDEAEDKDKTDNAAIEIATTDFTSEYAANNADEAVKTNDKDATPKDQQKSTEDGPAAKKRPPRDDIKYMWVSNIGRNVKATDLKKYFSQIGKVSTAKILTNGKNYYGYVSMETAELAAQCLKQLNNSLFDGKKITVSKDRPDLREKAKTDMKKKRVEKSEPEKKDEPKDKPEAEKAKDTTKEDKDKPADGKEVENRLNRTIESLKRKLRDTFADVNRYKHKMEEFQRRHDGMRKKITDMERELKKIRYENREDRRRLVIERDEFEKLKKLEEVRFEADKSIVNRELAEVRKLRANLNTKIEEFKRASKRARSPGPRGRSPLGQHGRSPVGHNKFRGDERPEKRSKREEMPRGRTPPPPPKLSDPVRKGVREPYPPGGRSYHPELDKRAGPGGLFDYRHKPSYSPQEAPRGSFPMSSYPKETRRPAPVSAPGTSYSVEPRYGGGYPPMSSNISVPQRSTNNHYYDGFSKPYNSHY